MFRPRPRRRGARPRSERGVGLVEYSLFFACFTLVAVPAAKVMNDGVRTYFQDTSAKVGQPVNRIQYDQNGLRPTLASTTSITVPAPTSTTTASTTTVVTTTTTPPTTTTTTLPPTTTTTTTTAPPTTTTSTTTTPAAPSVTAVIWGSSSTAGRGLWRATVVVQLTGNNGASVAGRSVSLTFQANNGATLGTSCVTDSSGTCSVAPTSGRPPTAVTVLVTAVNGVTLTNPGVATTLYAP